MRAFLPLVGWFLCTVALADLPNDPTLTEPSSLSADGLRLSDFLRQESKATGISLSADARLRDRRVFARISGQPRRVVLTYLAEVFHAEWSPVESGFRLSQKSDYREEEIHRVDNVLLESQQALRSEIVSAYELARKGPEFFQAWKADLDQRLGSLRTQRPIGWSTEYSQLLVQTESLGYRALGDESLRIMVLHLGQLSGPGLDRLVKGEPLEASFGSAATLGLGRVRVDPVAREIELNYLGFGVGAGAQQADLTLILVPSEDREEMPVHSDPWSEKTSSWNWLSRLTLRPGTSETRTMFPGDVDALDFAHRGYGVNIISEASRSRSLPFQEPSSVLQTWIERKPAGLMVRPGWLLFSAPNSRLTEIHGPEEEQLAAVERLGGRDISTIVRFVHSLSAASSGPSADELFPRRDCSWTTLTTKPFLWEFMSKLTPSQIARVELGQAIPYGEMSQEARRWFRVLLHHGSGQVAPEAILQSGGENRERLSFYFERYCRPFTRAIGSEGKVVSGGLNDGAESAFLSDQNRVQVEFFRYEFNFYFGTSFEESTKFTVNFDTRVPPPQPQVRGDEAPPHKHEGHGPE